MNPTAISQDALSSAIDEIARELELGRWIVRFALYEDDAIADYGFRKIKEAFEGIPGAEVWGEKHSPEDILNLEHPAERIHGASPASTGTRMTGWYGGEEGGQIDRHNEDQCRSAYEVSQRLVREAGKLGYGEYRAHLSFMDLAAEQYSLNDHAYRRFTEKLEDCLDPNGILSPGRHGIWPASMR